MGGPSFPIMVRVNRANIAGNEIHVLTHRSFTRKPTSLVERSCAKMACAGGVFGNSLAGKVKTNEQDMSTAKASDSLRDPVQPLLLDIAVLSLRVRVNGTLLAVRSTNCSCRGAGLHHLISPRNKTRKLS